MTDYSFTDRVLRVVRSIPRGKTMSYGEVARKAGSPRACRAVANVMSRNMDPTVPCHRVICGNGDPGGYNIRTRPDETLSKEVHAIVMKLPRSINQAWLASEVKKALLTAEGVVFK